MLANRTYSPGIASQPSAGVGAGNSVKSALASIATLLWAWHHRARSRAHLGALEPRLLKGIGLSKARCTREARKRFWQR